MAIVGYMLADLVILNSRAGLLPRQAPPMREALQQVSSTQSRGSYGTITSKNMFNMDGKIPPALNADPKNTTTEDDGGPPVPTQISGLVLIGTLVHTIPERSVASVKTPNGGEMVGAYRKGDTMDGAGEVLSIERGKLIFRNAANRRREYVELPQDGKINLGIASGQKPTARVEGEVSVISDTERTLKRDDVNRLTQNLPDLLQQARAVKDGDCFRMIDIMPGSIYERLGIRRGDCIRTVNGEAVDSPQKAMELYNALKNSSNISLGIDRNGRPENLNFSIQ